MRINEFFEMNYDMFGWLAPGGKVILATPKQAKAPNPIFHVDVAYELLGISTYEQAFEKGYIRWLLRNGMLKMENTELPANDEDILNTLSVGVPAIEQLAKTPAKFKHFVGKEAKKQEPMSVFGYEYTGGYQTKRGYFDDSSLRGLLNQMRATELRDNKLNERFDPFLNYAMFGWISPRGGVELATPAQARQDELVHHIELGADLGILSHTYHQAFEKGWIRWYISGERLCFECYWSPTTKSAIKTATAKILKLCTQPSKYRHFAIVPAGRKNNQAYNEMILINNYELETTFGYFQDSRIEYLLNKVEKAADEAKREAKRETNSGDDFEDPDDF